MSNKPTQYRAYEYTGDSLVYSIIEVDEILAEKDKEIAELKRKLENVKASMYCDVVDANMEIIKLKKEVLRQKRLRCYNLKMWCSAERFTNRSRTIPGARRWWERHFYSVCRLWEKFKEINK